jgi:NAD(P)H-dependent FMN reductase
VVGFLLPPHHPLAPLLPAPDSVVGDIEGVYLDRGDPQLHDRVHRVPQEHVSFIPASAWRSSGLIIGMPTYEFKMFPPMAHALDELARKRIVGKKPFRFGSYGWAGGVQKELDGIVSALKWESLELVRERSGELARMVKAHSPTHPL